MTGAYCPECGEGLIVQVGFDFETQQKIKANQLPRMIAYPIEKERLFT